MGTVHYADPLASKIKLRGECNRCGACCSGIAPDGVGWRCQYLVISPTIPLLYPGSTTCQKYQTRKNGMPIKLIRDDRQIEPGVCFHDSWNEVQVILPHIGKACSLTMYLED